MISKYLDNLSHVKKITSTDDIIFAIDSGQENSNETRKRAGLDPIKIYNIKFESDLIGEIDRKSLDVEDLQCYQHFFAEPNRAIKSKICSDLKKLTAIKLLTKKSKPLPSKTIVQNSENIFKSRGFKWDFLISKHNTMRIMLRTDFNEEEKFSGDEDSEKDGDLSMPIDCSVDNKKHVKHKMKCKVSTKYKLTELYNNMS